MSLGGRGTSPARDASALIGDLDWATTDLGGRETWPPILAAYTEMMLDAGAAVALAWGRTPTILLNDAWIGRFGPDALGERVPGQQRAPWRELERPIEELRAGAGVPKVHWATPQIELLMTPIFGAGGETSGVWIRVGEQGRAEGTSVSRERQRVQGWDVQHEVANLLAIIRSFVRRTAEKSGTVDDFVSSFEGRVAALSRLHSYMAHSPGGRADLETILREELRVAATGEPRIQVSGPPVELPRRLAQRIGLAFHELTTNAIKYGALSTPRGTVSVIWQQVAQGLRIEWQEHGVELASAPSVRGFGLEFLQRALPYDTGADVSWTLLRDGIGCRITVEAADRSTP